LNTACAPWPLAVLSSEFRVSRSEESKPETRDSKLEEYHFHLFPWFQPILIEIDSDHAVGFHQSENSSRLGWQRYRQQTISIALQSHANVVLATDLRWDIGFQCCLHGFGKSSYGLRVLTRQSSDQGSSEEIEN